MLLKSVLTRSPIRRHILHVSRAYSTQQPMTADYNRSSQFQAQSLQLFKPTIDLAIDAHLSDLSAGGPFVIADFGCSTGRNSSAAVSYVIERVQRKYGTGRYSSIMVVLNDLPSNHWDQLFQFLGDDERSFLRRHEGVFATVSGISFNKQVLPPNTLQLGISNIALHWLSRLPMQLANHCFMQFGSAEEQTAFKEQGVKDCYSFMAARSAELVRGGVVAVNAMTSQPESDGIYDAVYRAAESLHVRGMIESAELLRFNILNSYLSPDDVNDKSKYESLGLELLLAERLPLTRSADYEDFQQHGDVLLFATGCRNAFRSALDNTFVSALSPARTESAKTDISTEMWNAFLDIMIKEPRRFEYIWGHLCIVVRKL